jgi:hypothetical protein
VLKSTAVRGTDVRLRTRGSAERVDQGAVGVVQEEKAGEDGLGAG